ncbi:MAG: methyltransferase domain-containing protein [Elainellaceae cyanobacterium]
MDYVKYHIKDANSYLNVEGKKVLVVGCNRGEEVAHFVELNAKEVWGLDVVDEIGENFKHEKAKYVQMSAEEMDISDNTFDLVYSCATMEHVKNIEKAFPEMVRVAKPRGVIYSVSAPLWNSREGHHKSNIFDVNKYPWIHLRFTKDELKAKCRAGEISYPAWVTNIESHIEYMMDPRFFNRRPAKDYVNICEALKSVRIIRNGLSLQQEYYLALLTLGELKELLEGGLNSVELLALTHTFIGEKQQLTEPESGFSELQPGDSLDRERSDDQHARLKKRLRKKKAELRQAQEKIQEMENSKFWKLRNIWMDLRRRFS